VPDDEQLRLHQIRVVAEQKPYALSSNRSTQRTISSIGSKEGYGSIQEGLASELVGTVLENLNIVLYLT
jgi:hypothetical protein